jgi:hypothetical protein
MRPRFSLRLLIVGLTVASLARYWLFVRPISVAKLFVDLVNTKEYRKAELICRNSTHSFLLDQVENFGECEVEAKLLPRRWSNVIRFQQPMSVTVRNLKPISGTNDYIAARGYMMAGPISINPPVVYFEVFRR